MALSFDHIHLISADAKAAAHWYETMLGGRITGEHELRGAPQISVEVGGARLLIRGRRTGESPSPRPPMQDFADYSSHNVWGTDHFGYAFRGDLRRFCDELRGKGAEFLVEPWEFAPGALICYVSAPDGVSIEIVQARS